MRVTSEPEPLQVLSFPEFRALRGAEQTASIIERAVAAASDAIAITDSSLHDNPIVYVNPAVERLTGYSALETIGRSPRFLQGPPSEAEVLARARRALVQGHACAVTFLTYRKDGSTFWNHLRLSPVRGQGTLTHMIAVLRDATERVPAARRAGTRGAVAIAHRPLV